jgi:hypothetical protein
MGGERTLEAPIFIYTSINLRPRLNTVVATSNERSLNAYPELFQENVALHCQPQAPLPPL